MQLISSRIWTRIAVSISYVDNHYTTITSSVRQVILWIHWHRGRVYAHGPGNRGSIPDRVIPKTQKMVLDAYLPNTQHDKARIKGKWSIRRKGVAPFSPPQCCSFWKRSLPVTLDYGRPTYIFKRKCINMKKHKVFRGWFYW